MLLRFEKNGHLGFINISWAFAEFEADEKD